MYLAYFFLLRPINHSWATIAIGPNDKASFPAHLLMFAAARQDGSVLDDGLVCSLSQHLLNY
jgi:hypothetical protein